MDFLIFMSKTPSSTLPVPALQGRLRRVLECVPRVHRALGREDTDLDRLPGWSELRGKPRRIIAHEGRICLVCVLFGPSGAGKSTIFRLLTGIPVPAGETRRPLTFNCAVAVPEPLRDVVDPGELFPGYRMHPLTELDVLRDGRYPATDLFYQYYQDQESKQHPDSAWLVLVDVPDFNTVERANRVRAEAMLGRAETVVFAVYPEAYKDAAVMDQMRIAAGRAGHLAYVITKLTAQSEGDAANAAREIWENVLQHVRTAAAFQALRGDGSRIGEFLERTDVYYARRDAMPRLEDIRPLQPDAPDFCSMIKGQDAVAVYWSNLLEVVEQGLITAGAVAREAVDLRETLRKWLKTADRRVAEVSEHIAGSQFPAGELVELIIAVVKQNRPGWLRAMTLPVVQGAAVFLSVRRLFARFRGSQRGAALQDRLTLERERLDAAVDVLLDGWRSDFPGESAVFSAERCREAAQAVRGQEPPRVRDEWKDAVRSDVEQWSRQHPWYGSLVGTLSEMLVLLGGAALVLDLAISGGIFGTVGQLGVAGAAGAGSMGTGTVLKMFEELKLKDVLEKADAKWREQRRGELREHLWRHLAEPLFAARWRERIQVLEAADAEGCLRAVEETHDLLRAQRNSLSPAPRGDA